jgi:membrane dipeptidase
MPKARHMKRPLLLGLALSATTAMAQPDSRLHQRAVLVDTHNDFPSAGISKNLPFDGNLKGSTHSDLARMRAGGVDLQVFSIFCGPEQAKPYAWANREIDSVAAWVARNPGAMQWVHTHRELRRALRSGRLGTMMGVEGGHMIEDRLENLQALYDRGVRYLTLTWNNSTSWASSAADETTGKVTADRAGLNTLGREIVRRMNDLGMLIDVSHNGERTFWDVMATTRKPVIASHSSAYALCPHRRNLKDDQIRAIARNGGVVHLNFYAGFLDSSYERKALRLGERYRTETDSLVKAGMQPDYAQMIVAEKHRGDYDAIRPPLSLLLDHLDHVVRLVGVDHVGLGSDFDGIEAGPLGLDGVEDFPKITTALLERGYSAKDIRKILGGNFLRVLKANERR